MSVWMTLKAKAMVRYRTEIHETLEDACQLIYELDRVEVTHNTFPRTLMMFDPTILQQYAKKYEASPLSLPPTLLLTNTETSLTIFDKYPKSIYHFLVIPRILAGSAFVAKDLRNLNTLLTKGNKAEAKTLIEGLKRDAELVKGMVEKEMLKKYGYKWDVWMGFHAVPSLVYVPERWQQWYHQNL